jgi:hypothetical protein
MRRSRGCRLCGVSGGGHGDGARTGDDEVLQARLGGRDEQAGLYEADLGAVGRRRGAGRDAP